MMVKMAMAKVKARGMVVAFVEMAMKASRGKVETVMLAAAKAATARAAAEMAAGVTAAEATARQVNVSAMRATVAQVEVVQVAVGMGAAVLAAVARGVATWAAEVALSEAHGVGGGGLGGGGLGGGEVGAGGGGGGDVGGRVGGSRVRVAREGARGGGSMGGGGLGGGGLGGGEVGGGGEGGGGFAGGGGVDGGGRSGGREGNGGGGKGGGGEGEGGGGEGGGGVGEGGGRGNGLGGGAGGCGGAGGEKKKTAASTPLFTAVEQLRHCCAVVPEMHMLSTGHQPQPVAAMHSGCVVMAVQSAQHAPCAVYGKPVAQASVESWQVPSQYAQFGWAVHSPHEEKERQKSSDRKPSSRNCQVLPSASVWFRRLLMATWRTPTELESACQVPNSTALNSAECDTMVKVRKKSELGSGPSTPPSVQQVPHSHVAWPVPKDESHVNSFQSSDMIRFTPRFARLLSISSCRFALLLLLGTSLEITM